MVLRNGFHFSSICLVGICLAGISSICDLAQGAEPTQTSRKPNVIIFYADDLGWGETGIQGNPQIPTPHIDSIAKNGVRCTQGFVAATYCSPSRAGLLTGRYPTRFGHEFNRIANVSGLDLQETTLADRLHGLGYKTACVGKWHLGDGPEYRPTKRGFDEFFGTLANTPFFHPTKFVDSRVSNDVAEVSDENFYTTDEYAKRSVEWIGQQQQSPWFCIFRSMHSMLHCRLHRSIWIALNRSQIPSVSSSQP